MKRLLLVRHAKSDWSDGTLRDFDRPLNDRGEHDAPLMAKFLIKKDVKPSFLISSPAIRALSTAELFAEVFEIPKSNISTDMALYEAYTHQILSAVQNLPNQHDTIALFSHNPSISNAAAQFTDEYLSSIPTCAIAHIVADIDEWKNFDVDHAKLKDVWSPKNVLDAY